ncbi:hypothetical protein QYE76_054534 [Lolium multiflorum]|uniref:DUF4283 domain-containing protein n=1 Tax=Lolium multiflorum TaxID=4521 RepID=A0AAD8SZA0_LOLMU|nr:hypothetical protein QYE76_054534 [Lolium multiflorum]
MAVAKLLTIKGFSKVSLEKTMRAAWNTSTEVTLRPIGKNLFVIQAFCLGDWNRIMDEGPWLFRDCALTLEKYDGKTAAPSVVPSRVVAWIQIHRVPHLYKTEEILKQLAAKVGEVEKVEGCVASFGNGEFQRARVKLFADKPLPRVVTFSPEGCESMLLLVMYEKMPKLCAFCGMMGHEHLECGTGEYAQQMNCSLASGCWLLRSHGIRVPRVFLKGMVQRGMVIVGGEALQRIMVAVLMDVEVATHVAVVEGQVDHHWDLCGEEVTKAVLKVLNGEDIPEIINNAFIVLIPKVARPEELGKFRPISLYNVIYKIASKEIKKIVPSHGIRSFENVKLEEETRGFVLVQSRGNMFDIEEVVVNDSSLNKGALGIRNDLVHERPKEKSERRLGETSTAAALVAHRILPLLLFARARPLLPLPPHLRLVTRRCGLPCLYIDILLRPKAKVS